MLWCNCKIRTNCKLVENFWQVSFSFTNSLKSNRFSVLFLFFAIYLLSNIVVKQVLIFYPLILSSSKIISRINTNCKLVENFWHLSFSFSSYFKLLVIKICINFITLVKYGCTPQVSHEIQIFWVVLPQNCSDWIHRIVRDFLLNYHLF